MKPKEIEDIPGRFNVTDIDRNDVYLIRSLVEEFCHYFNFDFNKMMSRKFTKMVPTLNRSYERLYL
jgi:hypothetical protein